jgi:hypothetical protein
MWRTLLLAGLMAGIATLARAQEPSWRICQGGLGADGPVLTDCRPIDGVIDPQGREIWIRATVPAPIDGRPHALYVAGVASSEAWLNGQPLGANGRPGPSARLEAPGRYQIGLPIRETAWRSGGNDLVLHMSSFHGGLRFDRPIMAATVGPYPYPTNLALLAVTFVAAGALMAAAFGFGVIHALRRTASSLVLAAMAGVAALQAVVESLRSLFAYPYPLHAWRMGAIWALSAAFSVMLVAYVAGRFLPGGRRRMVALALVAVGATALAPGFDLKTGSALLVGVLLALVAAAVGVRRRQPGAPATLGYLALFLALGVAFPEWLVDLSYFLLAKKGTVPRPLSRPAWDEPLSSSGTRSGSCSSWSSSWRSGCRRPRRRRRRAGRLRSCCRGRRRLRRACRPSGRRSRCPCCGPSWCSCRPRPCVRVWASAAVTATVEAVKPRATTTARVLSWARMASSVLLL